MSKSLTKYSPGLMLVIGIAVIGLIIWLITRDKSAPATSRYQNEESWDIQYNPDGLPTKITIHRDARTG